MRCINCGSDNPEGTRFCGSCGSLLTASGANPEVIQPVSSEQPITARPTDPNFKPDKSSSKPPVSNKLWIIGGILGLLAILVTSKRVTATLAVASIILLLIAGLSYLKHSKIKAYVILAFAGAVFLVAGIGLLIPDKKPDADPVVATEAVTEATTTTVMTTTATTTATAIDTEPEETEEPENTSDEGPSDDEIRQKVENGDYKLVSKKFKKTMDSYEKFFDKYIKFMKKYTSGKGNPTKMLKDYSKIMSQYTDWIDKMDKIDPDELGPADAAYYLLIQARVEAKLLKAGF